MEHPVPLRLYNTMSRRVEPFRPADCGRVTFYSCGPTVYDDAHVGNFRSFLAADLLRRFIESPMCELDNDARPPTQRAAGRRVVHVMNITDVGHMTDDAEGGENGEDRMAVAGRRLEEAKKSGKLPAGASVDPRDPYAIAEFYAQRFLQDARTLGLGVAVDAQTDPTLMPRPTKMIAQMLAMIARLIESGHAYVAGAGGQRAVYFRVQSFPAYGLLSGNTLDNLRAGAGGRVSDEHQSGKEHPADFLLWKEDPSHIMKWPSPYGEGYPGWHIECSVMAAERLAGADGTIDLHSGGEDNIFPHHECEVAQSCCASGSPVFARMWFHPRHLFINGQKMSKSKGNFFTIRDLLEKGHQAGAIRLALINTHYRTNADFTEQGVRDAQRMIDRWRKVADAAPAGESADGSVGGAIDAPVLREVAACLHDDLNIAGALGVINTFVAGIAAPTPGDAVAMRAIDRVLGVLSLERAASATTDIGVFLDGLSPDPSVIAKLHERASAKKAKDFARSDAIRGDLSAMGLAIKDIAGGKVEVSRIK
jgi:cysteinyl-tRNA synthetase